MSTYGRAKYGMPQYPAQGTLPVAPAASNGAVTGAGGQRFLDLENPSLWLFAVGAGMLGLIAASTSVRIGPLRLSAAAGK